LVESINAVKARRFTVIAQGVRTNRIETANQERALADLHSQNLLLKGKGKVFKSSLEKEDTERWEAERAAAD
jgi:hypothetical protein